MKVSVVLSTLVVLFLFICAASARQPRSQPWLAVLSSTCRSRSTTNCIGVVLDDQWMLTTATCFRKCEVEIPHQLSVYVNIPPAAQKRLATSIRLGTKVDGSLVWQHPEYNPNTFANNLALVKLGCHNHTLEKLNLASNCSANECDGYVYAKNNKAIKLKRVEGNEAKCYSRPGTSTWYHLASTLQMVTTSSNNPDCMETSICKHAEQLKSFMQGNKTDCPNILPIVLPGPLPAPLPEPVISVVEPINDTVIKPTLIHENTTTIQLVSPTRSTSVKVPEMPTSSQVASSAVIPTPVSVSTSTEVPVATSSPTVTEAPTSILTQVLTSSQITTSVPTSSPTLTETSSVPTEAPVSTETSTSTQVSAIPTSTKAPTSTMILPSLSTSSSTSTQVSTSAKKETTTVVVTSTMMPASSPSSVMPSSTAVETSSSQAIVSTQVPTETPTSGCQLTIENGKTSSKTIFPGFLLITYTCNQGYRFKSGTKPLTLGCTGGEMAVKPPPCELIACPPLEPLADGQVVVSGSGLGSTATYSCNEGFILSDGFTVRVCKLNHEWSGKAGVCKRACPIPQSLVCNDGQRILPSVFKYGKIGESASYSVKDGYALIGEDPVCQPDSTWSTLPKCLKLCNEKEVIPNAKISIQRNASGYTREIICDEGYEAVGNNKQSCTNNGRWTPNFQECRKTCPQITLVSGQVNMLKSTSFLVAIMECNKGFHLEPALGAIVCTNGQWTPGIPRCVEDN